MIKAEEAIARYQVEPVGASVDDFAGLYCAISKLKAERPGKSRTTPGDLEKYSRKLSITAKRMRCFWSVPYEAPELQGIPKEALVDTKQLIIPTNIDISGTAIVNKKIPREKLGWDVEELEFAVTDNASFSLKRGLPPDGQSVALGGPTSSSSCLGGDSVDAGKSPSKILKVRHSDGDHVEEDLEFMASRVKQAVATKLCSLADKVVPVNVDHWFGKFVLFEKNSK